VERKLEVPECRWDPVVCDEAHKMSDRVLRQRGQVHEALSPRKAAVRSHAALPADDGNAAQRQGRGLPAFVWRCSTAIPSFRDGVHQVEVSEPMRLMVKESCSTSTERRTLRGASLVPSRTSSRTPRRASIKRGYGLCAHRIFRSWTIWTRSWRSSRDVAIGRERADSDCGVDRRSDDHEVKLAEPPKIT
jgi:hypothetical protein